MPIRFWNDKDDTRYKKAYFEKYPGIWRHGDYIVMQKDSSAIIYGRSDATLNPGGVRIGTAEIYRVVNQLDFVEDSVVIGQEYKGDVRVVLFVKLNPEVDLNNKIKDQIKTALKIQASPRHVPHYIFQVSDIPYTVSGKKVEMAVKQIVHHKLVENKAAIKNPESLDDFYQISQGL